MVVYLSTAELNGAYEFYAELNFKNSKETTEGGSGAGHYLSHLNINTIPAIDYSQSQNWELQATDWVNQGTVTAEWSDSEGDTWEDPESADSRYRKFNIVNKNYSKNINLSTRTITGTTIGEHENAGVFFTNSVSADFGWGYSAPHYDKITWWVEPALEGRHTPLYRDVGYTQMKYICLRDADTHDWYRIGGEGDAISIKVDSLRDDAITLYQWDIRYAWKGMGTRGWSDFSQDATVSVIDSFGNSGTFSITFPTDAWDPVIKWGKTWHTHAEVVKCANDMLPALFGTDKPSFAAATPEASGVATQTVNEGQVRWVIDELATDPYAADNNTTFLVAYWAGAPSSFMFETDHDFFDKGDRRGGKGWAVVVESEDIDSPNKKGDVFTVSGADVAAAVEGDIPVAGSHVLVAQINSVVGSSGPDKWVIPLWHFPHFSVWEQVAGSWALMGPVTWSPADKKFI